MKKMQPKIQSSCFQKTVTKILVYINVNKQYLNSSDQELGSGCYNKFLTAQ